MLLLYMRLSLFEHENMLTTTDFIFSFLRLQAKGELYIILEGHIVSNRDIILKSAKVKLPSWGAWDILKVTCLLWSRCLKEGTHVSTRGTIHDQRDVSQGYLN